MSGRKLEQNICLWSKYLITNYFLIMKVRNGDFGDFPGGQWLGLRAFTAGGIDLTPGGGTNPTCHAVQPKKEKK